VPGAPVEGQEEMSRQRRKCKNYPHAESAGNAEKRRPKTCPKRRLLDRIYRIHRIYFRCIDQFPEETREFLGFFGLLGFVGLLGFELA
jgi:hypothetical protein